MNNLTRARHQKGFTLVELLLSLAFVGFVLVFIIMTILQVMRTYNKGLAVKEINQTARTTFDDMTRIIRNTSSTAIKADATLIAAGRACFGGVSYVWNYRNQNVNLYTDSSRVTMARVNDLGGAMCTPVAGVYPNVPKDQSTILLTDRVWVQQFVFTPDVGGDIIDLTLRLSTSDDPANPALIADPVLVVKCRDGIVGQFCAIANFTTSVALKVK